MFAFSSSIDPPNIGGCATMGIRGITIKGWDFRICGLPCFRVYGFAFLGHKSSQPPARFRVEGLSTQNNLLPKTFYDTLVPKSSST